MSAELRFWQNKSMEEMTEQEWESLCDGCGKCCLHKLEDEDTGEVFYTEVACRLLDLNTCQCSRYSDRLKEVPECVQLRPKDIAQFKWLPSTCAYRLVAEGKPLPDWHPLVAVDSNSTHAHGHSVRGRVLPEHRVAEEDMEDHIVHWVE